MFFFFFVFSRVLIKDVSGFVILLFFLRHLTVFWFLFHHVSMILIGLYYILVFVCFCMFVCFIYRVHGACRLFGDFLIPVALGTICVRVAVVYKVSQAQPMKKQQKHHKESPKESGKALLKIQKTQQEILVCVF